LLYCWWWSFSRTWGFWNRMRRIYRFSQLRKWLSPVTLIRPCFSNDLSILNNITLL
jgi:hypothetical protein